MTLPHELAKNSTRLHVVEGYLKVQAAPDQFVAAIRAAKDGPATQLALQAEPFALSEKQAEAVLGMALRRLTGQGGVLRQSTPPTLNFLHLLHLLRVWSKPESKSLSDIGRVLVLNDPPARLEHDKLTAEQAELTARVADLNGWAV